MVIEDTDFKIVRKSDHYVLYFLKSKKELKEDNTDTFKLRGYYIVLDYAFIAIIRFRNSKEYPGKEKAASLEESLQALDQINTSLHDTIQQIYEPIHKLKHLYG